LTDAEQRREFGLVKAECLAMFTNQLSELWIHKIDRTQYLRAA